MRQFRRFARIATAAVIGFFIRVARRIAGRPPRIWHGFSTLHATKWMVEAERKAGFPSISVVLNMRSVRFALVRPEDFDVVFESQGERSDDAHWRALAHLLRHADVWNAYFDSLFFPHRDTRKNVLAFRLIRLAGIKIVVQPHGSDLVCTGRYPSRYGWPERMQEDYPQWDLDGYREIVDARVALFTRFAHLVLAGDSIYEAILPRWDLSFHTVPVDTASLVPRELPPRATPVVIHAPNHRHVKGTQYLLDAVDRLRARGFPIELRLIEGVPREEALRLYADVDIVADQFIMGAFGIFALEGMALGKPVLTYLDEQHLQRPAYSHPIVNTTPENLEQVLAVLLAMPELRQRIGRASRASIERYQSFDVVSQLWTRIYRHVWSGEPLDLASTPMFDPARHARSLTENPMEEDFWPVDVCDLIPRIRELARPLSDTAARTPRT